MVLTSTFTSREHPSEVKINISGDKFLPGAKLEPRNSSSPYKCAQLFIIQASESNGVIEDFCAIDGFGVREIEKGEDR